jgi:hypothetical protein
MSVASVCALGDARLPGLVESDARSLGLLALGRLTGHGSRGPAGFRGEAVRSGLGEGSRRAAYTVLGRAPPARVTEALDVRGAPKRPAASQTGELAATVRPVVERLGQILATGVGGRPGTTGRAPFRHLVPG